MHIAIFYQHYNNPDCPSMGRLYAFLRCWAPRHRITLLTATAYYSARLTDAFDWVPPGVEVHMLDVPYDNAMDARRRFFSFAGYAVKAFARGLTLPRPDVVLGISTPLTAAWAAAAVARLRGVPWVFQIQDLWPDFPVQMGAVPQPWLQRRLYALERRLYRSAAHLFPLSPDMATHLLRHGVASERMTMQFNGTDFWLLDATRDDEVAALRQAYRLEGKTVVLYAGTFGRANDIPTLLHTAERLRHRTDVQFVFIGTGYHAVDVGEAAGRLPNVTAVPAVPRHQAFRWFRLADLSLISFIDLPVLATNSPTKFFDSLAAGTPVIVTNPGWTKQFVQEHRCGWYVPASNAAALADCIDTLLDDPDEVCAAGTRGAAVARRQFDRTAFAEEMEHILETVVARNRR